MKEYFYNVNGTEFVDTKPFEKAWEEAVSLAKKEHCGITRTVVDGDTLRHEFYAKGGCFLPDRFYDAEKLYIF